MVSKLQMHIKDPIRYFYRKQQRRDKQGTQLSKSTT